ncbi:hypothetical protein BH23ACT9_BH23ACT9_28430 [soil metagenome]
MDLAERHAERVGTNVRDVLLKLTRQGVLSVADLADLADDQVSARAVAYAVGSLHPTPVADRIGAIYTLAQVRHWLRPPGTPSLTSEAVRKRALKHQLVAFRTDDNQWAFPAWQFTPAAGQLIPNQHDIDLWQSLPHDGWRSAATLAAWMNTRLASMDGQTPAQHVRVNGVDEVARAAVARLRVGAAA